MPGVYAQTNGPAVLYVRLPSPITPGSQGTSGTIPPVGTNATGVGGSYVPLGICRERITFEINFKDLPVPADNAGPNIPADVQYMGMDANIRAVLTEYDPVVLSALKQIGAGAEGQLDQIGTFYGASGRTFGIGCNSSAPPFLNRAWKFPNCIWRPLGEGHGTQFSEITMHIYAWALVGNALSAASTPLYFTPTPVP